VCVHSSRSAQTRIRLAPVFVPSFNIYVSDKALCLRNLCARGRKASKPHNMPLRWCLLNGTALHASTRPVSLSSSTRVRTRCVTNQARRRQRCKVIQATYPIPETEKEPSPIDTPQVRSEWQAAQGQGVKTLQAERGGFLRQISLKWYIVRFIICGNPKTNLKRFMF
jgi:hypothetical protein